MLSTLLNSDPAAFVAGLSEQDKAVLDQILEKELADLAAAKWDWPKAARPPQLAPPGNWLTWLVLAGRGFGKTRCGAEWVRQEVTEGRASRIALIAETQKDLEEVMVFGQSGLASVFPPHQRPKITKKPVRIEFHTGAIANGYNATEPDQLRGPQFDLAWCFIAGTLVETETGPVSIENVKNGDLVWTRSGLRKALEARKTSLNAELWELRTNSGRVLIGTADHPVYTEENGFVPLCNLANGVMLKGWQANGQFGAVRLGIITKIIIATAQASFFIARSIKTPSVNFRRKLMSIISMVTSSTMSFQTLSPLLVPSTLRLSRAAGLLLGTPKLDERTPQKRFGLSERQLSFLARFAGLCLNQLGCVLNSVRQSVARRISETVIPATDRDFVASVRHLNRKGEVYNLQVEGAQEYFANGILVHNCDEMAKWRYCRETWDQLQFGLRLGKHPRQIVTTTPRPIAVLREILSAPTTVMSRGITADNAANLAPSFIKSITDKYAGTRLGRQELSAEILDDVPDALWTRAALDRDRKKWDQIPSIKRVVVAIDPAAKKNEMPEDGAATGIIVAGIGDDNRGYVLDDATCRESPNGWARLAVACFDRYEANCIVGEINNGGEMVGATVRAVRPTIPFREVHASKGKWTRAEPIAALYEQGRISHVGTFAELEDEMVNFAVNGMVGDRSPDRVDALVWALTELFPQILRTPKKSEPAPPPVRLPNLGGIPAERGTGWMARR